MPFLSLYCDICVWYVIKGVWIERVEDLVAVSAERKSNPSTHQLIAPQIIQIMHDNTHQSSIEELLFSLTVLFILLSFEFGNCHSGPTAASILTLLLM